MVFGFFHPDLIKTFRSAQISLQTLMLLLPFLDVKIDRPPPAITLIFSEVISEWLLTCLPNVPLAITALAKRRTNIPRCPLMQTLVLCTHTSLQSSIFTQITKNTCKHLANMPVMGEFKEVKQLSRHSLGKKTSMPQYS